MTQVATKQNLNRRHFLQGAGVALALPMLEAMTPAFARAEINPVPRRFFGICNNLGLLPDLFFPEAASSGLGYLMLHANGRSETDQMFAALIVLAAMALALYFAMDRALTALLPWQPDSITEDTP